MPRWLRPAYLASFIFLLIPIALGSIWLNLPHPSLAEEEAEESTGIRRHTGYSTIQASWPEVGIERIDEESKAMVRFIVSAFEQEVEELREDIIQADMPGINMPSHELLISYDLTNPSSRTLSLLWNIWSYSGGAHGRLSLISANYDRNTGYPLLLEDLFVDPDLALVIFARESRRQLAEESDEARGELIIDDMLRVGTEPIEENYSTFILTPDGIQLHFSPYQVAPWAAGPQNVHVSLKALAAAKPHMEFWISE